VVIGVAGESVFMVTKMKMKLWLILQSLQRFPELAHSIVASFNIRKDTLPLYQSLRGIGGEAAHIPPIAQHYNVVWLVCLHSLGNPSDVIRRDTRFNLGVRDY
jgi:hypothetical protein